MSYRGEKNFQRERCPVDLFLGLERNRLGFQTDPNEALRQIEEAGAARPNPVTTARTKATPGTVPTPLIGRGRP